MPDAILIAGNARRFVDEVEDFAGYLRREAGIGRLRIHESRAAYMSRSVLEMWLVRAVGQRTARPLVILYCGHGGKDGWALDDVRTYEYSRLAGVLKEGRRPVLLVNDCCHAMAVSKALDSAGVRADRRSVVAAAEEGETTPGGLVRWVLNGWRQSKPARFGPELSWGTRLDHHFFPKKEAAAI